LPLVVLEGWLTLTPFTAVLLAFFQKIAALSPQNDLVLNLIHIKFHLSVLNYKRMFFVFFIAQACLSTECV
jgi:hypothetical protein